MTALSEYDFREHFARRYERQERRWATPGALACALEPGTGDSLPLQVIDRELVRLADRLVPADALAIFMSPQEGKPVYAGAMILMGDGSRKKLGDIRVGDYVITHLGRPRQVTAVHEQGALPIVKITTHAGRVIRAAADHPFLTPGGWVEAGKLTPGTGGGQGSSRVDGDVLAVIRAPSTSWPRGGGLTAEAARLLGYLAGDGNTTATAANLNASVTCADPEQRRDIARCAAALGFTARDKATASADPALWPRVACILLSGGVRPWIRLHGLAGCTSHTKRVPAAVFTSPPEVIAEFIGAYFACDGHVSRRGGARPDARLEFNSVSRGLIGDVQHLLLRLGIGSTIRPKRTFYKGQPYLSWRLWLRRQDDVARFCDAVPMASAKTQVLGQWGVVRTEFDGRYLADPVIAVEHEDPEPCRCLTVTEDHTFTVEDAVVHNSQRVSRRFPEWLLAHDPTLRIAIISYQDEIAIRWGRQILRDIRAANPAVMRIRVMPDSSAAGRWDTPEGGGLYCTGVGGALAGQPVQVMIIDDPVKDREQAESQTYRDRNWDWWESVAIPRLAPGGITVLMSTRWHQDDLPGRILSRPGPLRWRVLSMPAISEGPGDPLGRPAGAEFPSVRGRPAGYFRHLQATVTPYVFASIYQQRPAAAVGNFFRRASFRYWTGLPGRLHPGDALQRGVQAGAWCECEGQRVDLADPAVWRFATVDLAASTKTSADWTVVSVWAISREGDLLLLDRRRAHVEMADHFAMARPLRDRWRYDVMYVPREYWSKTLITDARAAGVPVAEVTTDSDKLTRAIPAAGRLHTGRAWFPAKTSGCDCGECDGNWLPEWEDELASFDKGAHDDQVDTFSAAARVAAAHWTPPAPPARPRPPSLAELEQIASAYTAATGVDAEPDLMTMPLG